MLGGTSAPPMPSLVMALCPSVLSMISCISFCFGTRMRFSCSAPMDGECMQIAARSSCVDGIAWRRKCKKVTDSSESTPRTVSCIVRPRVSGSTAAADFTYADSVANMVDSERAWPSRRTSSSADHPSLSKNGTKHSSRRPSRDTSV